MRSAPWLLPSRSTSRGENRYLSSSEPPEYSLTGIEMLPGVVGCIDPPSRYFAAVERLRRTGSVRRCIIVAVPRRLQAAPACRRQSSAAAKAASASSEKRTKRTSVGTPPGAVAVRTESTAIRAASVMGQP